MAFYWVNLGDTYSFVKSNSFLWAPTHGIYKKGGTFTKRFWDVVKDVKKGDIIFCCGDGPEIVYVAIANTDAYSCQKPFNKCFSKWENDGTRVDIDLTVLSPSIEKSEYADDFTDRFNSQCSDKIITEKGNRNQIYMASIPPAAGSILLNLIGDEALVIQAAIDNALNRQASKGSDTLTLQKARKGQGAFRSNVLKLWEQKCPLTGINNPKLLIASHIVPWPLSNPTEKVDKFNGFPLSPNADKLFDKGLISFDDKGEILINYKLIDQMTINALGLSCQMKIQLKKENKPYLKRHRELFDF